MKLILFDIDGILLPPGSVRLDYWDVIAKKHFGSGVDRTSIYTHGKTDREILFELIQTLGVKNPEKDKRFVEALNDIGKVVSEAIKNERIKKMPGAEEFIKILLNEKNIVIGLLTGNTYEKAKTKLINCGLWKYFNIGAFGDATKVRSGLVKLALEDAKNKLNIDFKKEDVYLIGDTIRDIRCAKEAGVKCVAVATGKESLEQLKSESPDYIFGDFNNPKTIVSALLG